MYKKYVIYLENIIIHTYIFTFILLAKLIWENYFDSPFKYNDMVINIMRYIVTCAPLIAVESYKLSEVKGFY